MIRRVVLMVALVASLSLGAQGAADAAAGRLIIPKTHTNAAIIKVPVAKGQLQMGNRLQGTVYTWNHGDPPCDPLGTTVYAGHAWRAGNGVADHWGGLKKGNLIKVGGCTFKVTSKQYWSAKRSVSPLFRVDGPPRVVLITCKADDYAKRTIVFARMVT
jgi:sortase (surface protein transpeptidase)